jgi:hypothetical protein
MALGINELTPISEVTVETKFEGVVETKDPQGRLGRRATGKQLEVFIARAGGDVDLLADAKVKAETGRAKGVEGALANLNTENKSNLVAAVNEVKGTADEAFEDGNTALVELPKKANKIITPQTKTLAQADVGDVPGVVTFDTSANPPAPQAAGSIIFADGSRFDLSASGDMTYTGADSVVTNIITSGAWKVSQIDTGSAAIQSEVNANSGAWLFGMWVSGEDVIDLPDVNRTAGQAVSDAAAAAATAVTALQAANTAAAAITAEAEARESADATLQGNIEAEAEARDEAIAAAQLAVQTWMPAVDTKAELPDPAAQTHTTSYLCRVMKDADPDNNGVWQLIAGATDWTPFSDNLDFIDETELEAAVNSNDTGTITPETEAFTDNTGFTFAAFFAAVVKKINGIIQALAGKQDALVNQTNIKSINSASLLGSGNIDVLAANFQSRVQVLSAGKDSLWKLQIGTGWSGNVRSGILELFYAAEYNSAYARVYISWKSGRANNYTFQILESWRSSGTGEFIEVVSAEGGWLTFKVKHPNPEYSTGMRLYWNSPFADWPIQAAE